MSDKKEPNCKNVCVNDIPYFRCWSDMGRIITNKRLEGKGCSKKGVIEQQDIYDI